MKGSFSMRGTASTRNIHTEENTAGCGFLETLPAGKDSDKFGVTLTARPYISSKTIYKSVKDLSKIINNPTQRLHFCQVLLK